MTHNSIEQLGEAVAAQALDDQGIELTAQSDLSPVEVAGMTAALIDGVEDATNDPVEKIRILSEAVEQVNDQPGEDVFDERLFMRDVIVQARTAQYRSVQRRRKRRIL